MVHEGYLYHIKDEYYIKMSDPNLSLNHGIGKERPNYLVIKDKYLYWFIPISSKVDKYKKIRNRKINRYGFCDSILIGKIYGKERAILIQNAFPCIHKYIDKVHIKNNKPAKIGKPLQKEILEKFNKLLKLKKHGVNLFFTDIDKLENLMLNELNVTV